jgi:hypothetical protein
VRSVVCDGFIGGDTSAKYSAVVVHVDGVRMSLNCGRQRASCLSRKCYMSMESYGGIILTGKPKSSEETCPFVILFITSPTWSNRDANQDFRGERPANKQRLSHGTALVLLLLLLLLKSTFKITLPAH